MANRSKISHWMSYLIFQNLPLPFHGTLVEVAFEPKNFFEKNISCTNSHNVSLWYTCASARGTSISPTIDRIQTSRRKTCWPPVRMQLRAESHKIVMIAFIKSPQILVCFFVSTGHLASGTFSLMLRNRGQQPLTFGFSFGSPRVFGHRK